MSDEFTFENYVSGILAKDKDEAPVCPFPSGGECYILRPDRKEKCLNCEFSQKDYQKQKEELEKAIDRILQEKRRNRKGSRVFCIRCGGGSRTPLYRWHNSYICKHCWNLLQIIGEEAFIRNFMEKEQEQQMSFFTEPEALKDILSQYS